MGTRFYTKTVSIPTLPGACFTVRPPHHHCPAHAAAESALSAHLSCSMPSEKGPFPGASSSSKRLMRKKYLGGKNTPTSSDCKSQAQQQHTTLRNQVTGGATFMTYSPSHVPCLVRKDLEVVRHTSYNSTQEMFLAQVGIQNSFSEDHEGSQKPFFVSHRETIRQAAQASNIVSHSHWLGATRDLVCLHQAEPALLRVHVCQS